MLEIRSIFHIEQEIYRRDISKNKSTDQKDFFFFFSFFLPFFFFFFFSFFFANSVICFWNKKLNQI